MGVLPGEPRSAECKHCVQYQVKEYNHHEHDHPLICMHWRDVRWVYVELQQLRETYSVKAETFENVTVIKSACLTSIGDDNSFT